MANNLEQQIESDLLKLLSGIRGVTCYSHRAKPENQQYPSVTARCDRLEPEKGLERAGVYSADLQLIVETHRGDDRDGSGEAALIGEVRSAIAGNDLASRIDAASDLTVYAAIPGAEYENPDAQLRSFTMELVLKLTK